jgi:hypothetical protein
MRPCLALASFAVIHSLPPGTVVVCASPAVLVASAMSLGSTYPSRPVFGVIAPPQHHGIEHVVGVLVQELASDDSFDCLAEVVIDVFVIADLPHHVAGLQAEPDSDAVLKRALRLSRDLSHCVLVPFHSVKLPVVPRARS